MAHQHVQHGGSSVPSYYLPQQQQQQPSRLDKLQQLDSMDRGDEGGGQNNMATMMHMLQTLYGIQQQQQEAPGKAALEKAQTDRLGAETDMYNREKTGVPTRQNELEFLMKTGHNLPGGIMEKEANQRDSDKEYRTFEEKARGPQGMTPDDYNHVTQTLGGQTAEYFKGMHPQPPVPANLQQSIPEQYRNDPKVAASLTELQAKNQQGQTEDPGLMEARKQANLQVHPFNQFVHDMLHPQEFPPGSWGPLDSSGPLGSGQRDWLGRVKSSVPSNIQPAQ